MIAIKPHLIRLLSFDPGTTVTGWAMSVYDTKQSSMTVHKYGRITPTAMAKKDKDECAKYSQQLIALSYLRQEVSALITAWKPNYIVSEDAFLNHKFPNAHVALTLCVFTMAQVCRDLHQMPFYKLAPCNIKRLVSGTGHADKLAMQTAILQNKQIVVKETKQNPISNMSEHEADAIGVGYAFTLQLPTLLTEKI